MEDLTRALGLWSSRAYLVLGVAYVVVIVGGFISNRKDSSVTIDGARGVHRHGTELEHLGLEHRTPLAVPPTGRR